jgi:large subunit ribosomal protein L21
MYALVEIKGKQYKAEQGAVLKIDKTANVKGDQLEFDSVLLISDGDDVKVGSPYVDGAKVKTVVEETKRDRKVTVFKYKRRKNYRKTRGHRQAYTYVRVEEIVGA